MYAKKIVKYQIGMCSRSPPLVYIYTRVCIYIHTSIYVYVCFFFNSKIFPPTVQLIEPGVPYLEKQDSRASPVNGIYPVFLKTV